MTEPNDQTLHLEPPEWLASLLPEPQELEDDQEEPNNLTLGFV